jgi:hypothetical protein
MSWPSVQQPVGTHVQEEAELVGLPARARRLVGARAALHVFDHGSLTITLR